MHMLNIHAAKSQLSRLIELVAVGEEVITITDGKNNVFVSAVSAWEIRLKKALGKLEAPDDLEAAITASRFEPLPIKINHQLSTYGVPILAA